MYTLDRFVNRKAVTVATKIPTEEMRAILEHIAFKTKDGWEFRLPFDQSFVDKCVLSLFIFNCRWLLSIAKLFFFVKNRKMPFPAACLENSLKAKRVNFIFFVGKHRLKRY